MKNSRAGFTLVELVVVIAILGILAGITMPHFMSANMSARGSKILADMNSCEASINIYYAKNSTYPADKETIVSSYLASWPKPPVGKALVKKHDGNDLILNVQANSYVYVKPSSGSELDVRVGRITLGGMTVEDILSTAETSLTLLDG
ncbi:MAG: type II secretion system protein [Acidaminococcaceae bacterium]